MTATAEITTATRENVLLIPNGALRFTPPTESDRDQRSAGGIVSSLIPHPPAPETKKYIVSVPQTAEQRVWILHDGRPKPVTTTVGVSNGRYTELAGEELVAGERLITGIAEGSE
jgi:HlyD family secretion protein